MLKIQFKDHRKPAMWLVDSLLKLGRDPNCEIVVEDSNVDLEHCQLLIEHEDITLTNLSHNKSIFVNEIPVVKTHKLVAWDIIRLGDVELEIIDPLSERSSPPVPVQSNKTVIRPIISPWMLKANSSPLAGQFFQVNHAFTIGRDDGADIVVPLSFISRIHAKLLVKRGKLFIEDLESSNGTFVNDEKIKSRQLENGDEVRLDEFSFSVIGPDGINKSTPPIKIKSKGAKKLARPTATTNHEEASISTQKIFLHDISVTSTGKVYEINRRKNHLSKMLGHHLSTSETSVSARHIYLSEEDVGWEVINNGAADGLLVNGKMQTRAVLRDGDEMIVGGTKLKFQDNGETPANYFVPTKEESSMVKIVFVLTLIAGALAIAYTQGWL